MPADFEKEPFCYNEPECLPEPQPQPVNPGLPVAVDTPEKEKEETVSIYRAPHKGQYERVLAIGHWPDDVLGDSHGPIDATPYNGRLYFAAPGNREIAEEWARLPTYDPVIEFVFEKDWYLSNLKKYEQKYLGRNGFEVAVPAHILPGMNANTLYRR
jgi:hypothetical protein